MLSALPSHIIVSFALCFGPLATTSSESLCWAAASVRIRHIIDGDVERNVTVFVLFSIIFSSAIPAFHVRCITSMFKRDKNAFDVESESLTFTSAPKTITVCLEDYRC